MSLSSKIWFPIALGCAVFGSIAADCSDAPTPSAFFSYSPVPSPDTVIYEVSGYKTRRSGDFEAVQLDGSLLDSLSDADIWAGADSIPEDTLVRLRARDTLIAPDSLREADPFRFKYYAALIDSLEHKLASDSLQASCDTMMARGDTLMFRSDSADRFKLDSLYVCDSVARAKAAFLAWYASLDKNARKKYDAEQRDLRKMAEMDSIARVKDRKKAEKDSIIENTPRILNTYALTDTMHYKQTIRWTLDRDFGDLVQPAIPDTSCNYHFYEYQFLRKDVNATWLGVAGAPGQYYNYFNREGESKVEFFNAYDMWTYTPSTMEHFNTKTPRTELAYYGSLLDSRDKEYDNIRIFTTQNITPALNFSLLYEKYGGGGMLVNQKTMNKTFAFGANYLGKRYLMHAGFIHDRVETGENGGVRDVSEIRDTTLEIREVKVRSTTGQSKTLKNTVFLDQQLRLASDSTEFDKPSAFVGHSLEYSAYSRNYTPAKEFSDSLFQSRFENKVYIRLQPFGPGSALSKLDVGIGDRYETFNNVQEDSSMVLSKENTLYAYAGLQGSFVDKIDWNARGHFSLAGDNAGDFDLSFDIGARFYPFRKSRTSPLTLKAGISTSLERPNFYQRHMFSITDPGMRWDCNFDKASSTRIEAEVDIPYWKFDAKLGYSVLANNIYYNASGLAAQNTAAMSVLSAYLHKDFTLWNFLHLDNRVLLQYSSDQAVVPVPLAAFNLKYYVQFPVQKDVMDMQIGVNAWVNTKWHAPGWNPVNGTFYNQREELYSNGPFFDLFINMQWKELTVFFKWENLGKGWPMDKYDYFSAHRYVVTQNGGILAFKFGIFWPFHMSAIPNPKAKR